LHPYILGTHRATNPEGDQQLVAINTQKKRWCFVE
jgi:hypothetical protein